MKSSAIISHTVYAEPGSVLEQVIHQFIKDRADNRKKRAADFIKRKEKQLKKLDRRL